MYEYKGKVTKVVDGDTIDVQVDLGFYISMNSRFRFSRINAWEVKGADAVKGQAAKAFVVEALAKVNNEVVIRTKKDGADKYGRYLAEILIGDLNLNDELLRLGHAVPYKG